MRNVHEPDTENGHLKVVRGCAVQPFHLRDRQQFLGKTRWEAKSALCFVISTCALLGPGRDCHVPSASQGQLAEVGALLGQCGLQGGSVQEGSCS